VLDRNTNIVDVGPNNSSEVTVYSFTVPAGTLGPDGKLRGEVFSDYTNNSGSNKNLTIKLKFGSSLCASLTITSIPSQTAAGVLHIEFYLANMFGNVGNQKGGFTAVLDRSEFGGTNQGIFAATGMCFVNTGVVNAAVSITLQHSAADANLSSQKQFAILERL